MGINNLIIYIMTFFMIIGAIDRVLGNRFGYGKKFEEGILAIGSISLAMLGILSFSPIFANVLSPIISPFYTIIGADPAMFAGTILSNDLGGYVLAKKLASSYEIEMFSGLFLGGTIGATLSFSLPVALGIIEKEDEKIFSKGMLAGLSTVPFGCFIGGIIAKFPIPLLIINLIPLILFTNLICFALIRFPHKVTKGFNFFGKFMFFATTIGLALQIIEVMTGVIIIKDMIPVAEGIKIAGNVGMTLAGAFPLLLFITNFFTKPLMKIGRLFNINEKSTVGLITCLAHSIPMFNILKEMDTRGKLLNIAFSVSGAFMLGSHLGFTAGVDKTLVFPVMVAKFVGAISAMFVANHIYNKEYKTKNI